MTNSTRKPRTNSIGVFRTDLPAMIVATQANICTPLGMAISRLAAEKKLSERFGRPVANMWCTHTPNPMTAIVMVARARYV